MWLIHFQTVTAICSHLRYSLLSHAQCYLQIVSVNCAAAAAAAALTWHVRRPAVIRDDKHFENKLCCQALTIDA